MLKSAAAVLGFLVALSTAYYLSFWGYFALDAFQYVAVGDIIKGIAYPLRFPGAWLGVLFVFGVVLMGVAITHGSDSEVKGFKQPVLTLLAITVGMLGIYWSFPDKKYAGLGFSIAFSFLLMTLYFMFYRMDKNRQADLGKNYKAEEHSPLLLTYNFAVVYAMIYLFINAIVAGQVQAREIHDGLRYDYVLAEDLPAGKVKTKQPYLLYLGLISEKYIFMDRGEIDCFIVDKSELPILKIHHFDAADDATWRTWNAVIHRQMGEPRRPLQRKPSEVGQ